MNILFIHQNFPGQFRHIALSLAREDKHHILCLCEEHAPSLPGIEKVVYKPSRKGTPKIHGYVAELEAHVIRGQEVARALLSLKQKGYKPDIIVAHMGWGEALYPKDIYPEATLITFFEFFYHAEGADVGFDPEYPSTLNDRLRIRTKNATNLLSLHAADIGISPTAWQRSLYPVEFHSKLRLIHEGINTDIAVPDAKACITLPSGLQLTKKDEVITYVSRNLEPYRGFHIFMRAVEIICQRRPDCHVIIVGGDEVSYGRKLPAGETYRRQMLKEVSINPARVHFLGKIPYAQYLKVLQVSSAHVYLTIPFVLSWSMLEAMSAGCVVIGSATPPVQEVIEHEVNGLLVDFFSPQQIADMANKVFDDKTRLVRIGKNARKTILRNFNLQAGIDGYRKLFAEFTSIK